MKNLLESEVMPLVLLIGLCAIADTLFLLGGV